jgi:hypothetical protein
MIRTILASPWLPLFYWVVTVVAVTLAGPEWLRGGLNRLASRKVVSSNSLTAAAIHDDFSLPPTNPGRQGIAPMGDQMHFWSPIFSMVRRSERTAPEPGAEMLSNIGSTPAEVQATHIEPVNMLSIRLETGEPAKAKRLAIQCRTSLAIRNRHGMFATIHGVVTQEVVSSTGKILIMAGSRVIGSGLLDPENGRFKSDGLWSIIFDDTELKVEAQLLDRPGGLPGLLGQTVPNGVPSLSKENCMPDSQTVLVARNSPFVLETHGEILLRDLQSPPASD